MASSRIFRIAIAGIGATGGYYGGRLAAHYAGSNTQVHFITKPAYAAALRDAGLQLITPQGTQTIHAHAVTDTPASIGVQDLILCCVKSYDLTAMIESLRPCIGAHTIILPLLNGVDAAAQVRTLLPGAQVWEGCVYIVARLLQPGVVEETGNVNQLHFGADAADPATLGFVAQIFSDAGIQNFLSHDIRATLWQKFLFISPVASITSYCDESLGAVMAHPLHKAMLQELIYELKQLADAKGITLASDSIDQVLQRCASLPYDTTSSMHSDFRKGGRTEVDSLTGYVVREALALGMHLPLYEKVFDKLKV